ncbi:DMT family transporter [Fluviibacterium sp. DFM31]|uniref:DMT family transporter n=1 Tax=Meridianimarinicoccus marinus TaxID=3231483 RepID=A0ABV3L2A1_9RHOB
MSNRPLLVAAAFATLAQLLWAGNFITARALREVIDPINLNFLRWLLAALILLPLVLRDRRAIAAALRAQPLQILMLSALAITGFNTLLYAGLQTATVAEAGIITGLAPILILLLARFWDGTALTGGQIAGGALAFLGALLVLSGKEGGGVSGIRGPAFLLGAATAWAAYTVAYQRFKIPLKPLSALGLFAALGSLLMLALVPFAPTPIGQIPLTGEVIFGLTYITLGASILALYSWNRGASVLGPARVGVFLQLIPVFAMILGVLILGETVTPMQIAGLACVFGGVLVAQRRGRVSAVQAGAQR